MRPICFFSDFGAADASAGVCRAVIERLAPGVRVIDITHGLPQRDVLAGSVVLRGAVPYLPDGAVCLAVVDPGVGGARRAVALRSRHDHYFVGPDNGLLPPAVDAAGGVDAAVELTNADVWLRPLSRTFHGRDVFAPAAARLAAGAALEDLGSAIDPATLVRLSLPAPHWFPHGVTATVALIDSFGNVLLNLEGDALEAIRVGEPAEVICPSGLYGARVGGTYGDVPVGGLVVLVDSSGVAALAVNGASAAELLGLASGDRVELRLPELRAAS